MILINDENSGHCTDIKILQRQITECINELREEIDERQKDFVDAEYPPLTLTEIFNSIAFFQSQLYDLGEIEKVPFDVLVVIEKEKL